MVEVSFETNLRCQSCLKTVGPVLDGESSVESWNADLTDPRKLLVVQLADSGEPGRVAELLESVGYEARPINGAEPRPATVEPPPGPGLSFSTYKPLLLVFAYVLGATILAESIHGDFVWRRAMSYFMGFFFLGFAFFKLLDVTAFADAFSTYDVIAKRSRGYALLYPWVELVLGVMFVTGAALVVANVATAAVMGVGLVGVVSAVRQKQRIQCACLGTTFNLPMTVVTIIENSVMLAMAVVMLLAGRPV